MLRSSVIALAILFVAVVLLARRTAVTSGAPEATAQQPVETPMAVAPILRPRAENAAAAALAQAMAMPEEKVSVAVGEAVAEWGGQDPKTAFEALLRMDPGPARANALIQLAGVWARQDPRGAAEAFFAQTSGSERSRGVAQALSIWAKSDPAAARHWLNETVGESGLSGLLRTQLYASWAGTDPAAALADAIATGSGGTEVNSVFGAWAASNLEEAVKYQDEKLSLNMQKQTRPVLLLSAAAQKSPLAEPLLIDFLESGPTTTDLLQIGKALSGTQPRLAAMVADRLSPSAEAEALRRRLTSLYGEDFRTVAVISDSQEAGIPSAQRQTIPQASAEPFNSIPR